MFKKYFLFLLLIIPGFIFSQASKENSIHVQDAIDSLAKLPYSNEVYKAHQGILLESQQIEYKKGEALANKWIGNYFIETGQLDSALIHYQELVTSAEELEDSTLLANGFFSMGVVNSELLQVDKSIELFEKAKTVAQEIDNKILHAMSINGLGVAHSKRDDDYDIAIKYLLEAKDLMTELEVMGGVQNANYNIATIYLLQKKPLAAKPFALDFLDYSTGKKDSIDMASGNAIVGKTYLELKEFDRSLKYCEFALQLIELNQMKSLKSDVLLDISEIYKNKKDYQQALLYHQKYHDADQEFLNQETQKNIAKLDVKFETERNKKELLLKEKEVSEIRQAAKLKQQNMLMLTGGLGACLLIGFLYFLKVRSSNSEKVAKEKLMRTELEFKDLKTKQLQSELENKNSDLTNFALDISRKNEFSSALIERLEQLKKAKPDELKDKLRDTISFTTNHLQINEDLALLQENVDTINQEFYTKLEARFGKLSANDKHLAALVRLNLSNKEVAAIRGISTGSAKTGRYRLRKKFNLDSEIDIVSFLQNL